MEKRLFVSLILGLMCSTPDWLSGAMGDNGGAGGPMYPLHQMALEGKVDRLRALVEQGGYDINTQNSDGETPLHCAARAGNANCVTALVSLGANHEVIENRYHETAMYLAVTYLRVNCVAALISGLRDRWLAENKTESVIDTLVDNLLACVKEIRYHYHLMPDCDLITNEKKRRAIRMIIWNGRLSLKLLCAAHLESQRIRILPQDAPCELLDYFSILHKWTMRDDALSLCSLEVRRTGILGAAVRVPAPDSGHDGGGSGGAVHGTGIRGTGIRGAALRVHTVSRGTARGRGAGVRVRGASTRGRGACGRRKCRRK